MAKDRLSFINQALATIGAPPISSTTGNDARQVAAAQLYDPVAEELLGQHRWRFASTSYQLSRLAAAPTTKWAAAYTLPDDVLVIHGIYVNDYSIPFDRFDMQIHCDAVETDTVYASVTRAVAETYWPAYFLAALRSRLAAAFALAIARDEGLANIHEGKALRAFSQAKLLDSQGRSAPKMPVGGLAAFTAGRP